MSLLYAVLLCLIVFCASIIRGYAGFGFSAIAVAISLIFIPPLEAIIMVLFLEVCASVQMARKVWKHIHWRLCLHIIVASIIFIPLGKMVLRWVNVDIMLVVVAIALLLAVLFNWNYSLFRMKSGSFNWLLTVCVSGFMNGMMAMRGSWFRYF